MRRAAAAALTLHQSWSTPSNDVVYGADAPSHSCASAQLAASASIDRYHHVPSDVYAARRTPSPSSASSTPRVGSGSE